jgi:hypothetical protein
MGKDYVFLLPDIWQGVSSVLQQNPRVRICKDWASGTPWKETKHLIRGIAGSI